MTQLLQIKASAGSGKTFTLTRLFLRLLAHAGDIRARRPQEYNASRYHAEAQSSFNDEFVSYDWSDILAMTFTNSAATEMKKRLISDLKNRALQASSAEDAGETISELSPQEAAIWVERIIHRYGALNIRTIDSLLTLLVRLSALDLGLPPDFEPVFANEEFFEPLIDEIIEEARAPEHALHSTLRDACDSLLYYKGVSGEKGFTAGQKLRTKLNKLLTWQLQDTKELPIYQKGIITDILNHLYEEVQIKADALITLLGEENLSVNKSAFSVFAACTELRPYANASTSVYLKKATLEACLNKTSKGKESPQAEAAYQALCVANFLLATESTLLKGALLDLPLINLVREIMRRLPEYQMRHNKVPSQTLALLANQAVTDYNGVPVAFCRMGSRLSHILIDEFQDTSRDQWHAIKPLAIEALSQGGSFTWVGDIKQAIYSWRGGDSSLFDEVKKDADLVQITKPKEDNLASNWRSWEAIVHYNNTLFENLADPVCAKEALEAVLKTGTPSFILDETAEKLSKNFSKAAQLVAKEEHKQHGYVEMHYIEEASKSELSCAIQAKLHTLFTENLAKRHPWRHIAVLVRSNTQAMEVASWLMSWRIPVITSNSLRLADHPIITQTLAMLAFIDYPRDDLAFWECVTGHELFGSVCGIQRQDFEDWLVQKSSRKGPIFTLFRTEFPTLWEEWFAPFYSRAGLMSAYDTVRELFYRYNVFERYPQEAGFLRRFLEIVYSAEGQGYISLSTFLDFWHKQAGEEKVPMPDGMDAVQVMTMHKSKGLEFPVVVIPYHQGGEKKDRPPVRHKMHGHDLMVPLCPELGDPYYEHKAYEACEKFHLLYVAWTRPREELYAFVGKYSQDQNKFSDGIKVLLDRICTTDTGHESIILQRGTLGPAKADAAWPEQRPHAEETEKRHSSSVETALCTHYADLDSTKADAEWKEWSPMQWLPSLKIFRNPLEKSEFNERQRGMLVHACLEALRLHAHQDYNDFDVQHAAMNDDALMTEEVRAAVQNAMRAFRLPIPKPHEVESELIDILTWFARLPDAAYWLQYGTPEQAILDSQGKRHRVDLLVDDGTERIVVEYKTGHSKTDYDKHSSQVRRYLTLLTAMHQGTNTMDKSISCRGIIIYLDQRRTCDVLLEANHA